ncbi:hypothetical protein TREMEDRAFT_65261 [Tremella mesenterica DSM 1558]|uniref:uncharacterized protein n=1 Tax=Tremella mesenterica (strain ATCC 24925 / CBS 8224 / DSM 1558 / NBRC 9311 / NRRL Y-6157 / RJB 2259-6 / UBC 559-6) TaxID=578456 RepID=UPI00032C5637|nr:uncharacterized protein TREMEDRAFT_65261 [Tremella mesenterica DSM 1558]EIW66853.1 hypothetical protein TREMEDRAFT_65261 [Tremella mesenterica DSM 1558]
MTIAQEQSVKVSDGDLLQDWAMGHMDPSWCRMILDEWVGGVSDYVVSNVTKIYELTPTIASIRKATTFMRSGPDLSFVVGEWICDEGKCKVRGLVGSLRAGLQRCLPGIGKLTGFWELACDPVEIPTIRADLSKEHDCIDERFNDGTMTNDK